MNTEQEFRNVANQLVTSLVGPSLVESWWASPNQAFEGLTPESQWQLGSDRVVNYMMHLAFSGGGS